MMNEWSGILSSFEWYGIVPNLGKGEDSLQILYNAKKIFSYSSGG